MEHIDIEEAELTDEAADEYFHRHFTVKCSGCDRTDSDTEAALRLKGWRLSTIERCPPCKVLDDIWEAGIALGRVRKTLDRMDAEDYDIFQHIH